jgi:hypothetical protein
VSGYEASGVRPLAPRQPSRTAIRAPPAGARVTNTASASPHQRWYWLAPERSAQVRAYIQIRSPESNVPLPFTSSTSTGMSIVPYEGFCPSRNSWRCTATCAIGTFAG